MKLFDWRRFKIFLGLLATGRPEPVQQAERIVQMLRDVVLPAKAGLCVVVLYYLFYSGWLTDEQTTRSVALDTLRKWFQIYLVCNLVAALAFFAWRRLPTDLIQWLAFVLGLLDGLFVAGITTVTGGVESIAFWLFPALIVLNALTIPLATPQIVLNLVLSLFYAGAVLLTPRIGWEESLASRQALADMVAQMSHAGHGGATNPVALGFHAAGTNGGATGTGAVFQASQNGTASAPWVRRDTLAKLYRASQGFQEEDASATEEVTPKQLALPLTVLWLLALTCYGTQVLLERQRQAALEAAEFLARERQLHSAGRLAAEFAHQIKNPLAIINNAAYSLQRSLPDRKGSAALQIEIIQEEVARADKVITQIMGYAQLSEGRVERLKLVEEIERAAAEVFPPGIPTEIALKKRYQGPMPTLLMQRGHLMQILENLLLNAREALGNRGTVVITASCKRDDDVEITVTDDGPGIAPEKLGRVFEAYFTTKDKGTGLGLAIVKHNAELYGGEARVESVLGKGAKFTVVLPVKAQPKPFQK